MNESAGGAPGERVDLGRCLGGGPVTREALERLAHEGDGTACGRVARTVLGVLFKRPEGSAKVVTGA